MIYIRPVRYLAFYYREFSKKRCEVGPLLPSKNLSELLGWFFFSPSLSSTYFDKSFVTDYLFFIFFFSVGSLPCDRRNVNFPLRSDVPFRGKSSRYLFWVFVVVYTLENDRGLSA